MSSTQRLQTYLTILSAENLDAVIVAALRMFVQLVQPDAVCLLLWDAELGRYVIGDTFKGSLDINVATLQRQALGFMNKQMPSDLLTWQCLFLGEKSAPVGAMLFVNGTPLPQDEAERYARYVGRGIDVNYRLEIAEREHTQLEKDAERLEHLLRAVEQQQRTIDRLLATEREWSAELERRVNERTIALQTAQKHLIQSEKLAAIGQLASSLAHELNNPLQAIQSGIELMMDELDGDNIAQIREDLPIIQDELERIASIFRQMLDFYRPTSQEHRPLDLNEICHGVNILMRKRLQQSNVSLQLELAPSLPLTCGDRNQIKQILINLILNATEAMEDQGGNVVLVTTVNETADHTCIQVIDNGPGIKPEHMAHLFEPLFTTKTRGLGLGLAISREIAEKHGGVLTVNTQTQYGTAFTLRLPARKECNNQ